VVLGVISDIHGNATALEAALRVLAAARVERIVCLGDIVGYGPDPAKCIGLVRESCDVVLAGNHDRGALDPSTHDWFNDDARRALEWTMRKLSDADRAWLTSLPGQDAYAGALLCHGSPSDPDAYLHSPEAVAFAMRACDEGVVFYGHTHRPALFEIPLGQTIDAREVALPVGTSVGLGLSAARWAANPGSVGQPRDGDPRAAFMTYDPSHPAVTLHRAHYDVASVQVRMRKARLPRYLIDRLRLGF